MVFRRRTFRRRRFGRRMMRRRRPSLKRRYYRKRRYGRRSRRGGRFSKIIKFGNFSGNVAYAKHTYCQLLKLNCALTKSFNGWRMNSIYDPDATAGLGQHSANNYTVMATMFNQYRVEKSVLSLKVIPYLGSGDGGGIAMWLDRWHTGEPAYVNQGDPTVVAERGNSTLKFVSYNAGNEVYGPSDRTHRFKARYNFYKEQARTRESDGNFAASPGSNPARESQVFFNYAPITGPFPEGSQLHVWVKIIYYVKWMKSGQQQVHDNVL